MLRTGKSVQQIKQEAIDKGYSEIEEAELLSTMRILLSMPVQEVNAMIERGDVPVIIVQLLGDLNSPKYRDKLLSRLYGTPKRSKESQPVSKIKPGQKLTPEVTRTLSDADLEHFLRTGLPTLKLNNIPDAESA